MHESHPLPRVPQSAQDWLQSYLDTAYRVYLPTATECVLIDRRAPALDHWMDEHNERCAAIVTACNPHSRPLGPFGNRRAQRALLDVLRAHGHAILPGCNRAIDGDWPDEPSFAIAGLSRGGARRLGARYKQNAVVWLPRGGRAELLWVLR